ncbi:periplasmic heavy metal sensor [Algihabitans albus]|uniref:periplasmic heavy metal sensor n=1 Tax=Algihabitans albus TaxID=2164067 RepID=UPI000E5D087E|nr:periplasmic heavy metal sensor [Algihabitans albus]
MRAPLLTTALVLSLLLNLGLLGGAVFGHFAASDERPDPQAHIDSVAERLALTPQETEGLRNFRQRTLDGLASQYSEGTSTRDELVDMLNDEVYDTARVEQILNTRDGDRNAFWAGVGTDLHGWAADLSPDQRVQFVEMAKERDFFRHLFARTD